MDDKTLQALTELAQKMGTTAEHLWGVLIRQAPISGAVSFLTIVLMISVSVIWWWVVIRKTTCKHGERSSEWVEEGKFFAIISAAVFSIITLLSCLSELALIVAAFVNPEYWALRQILGSH